MEFKLKIDDGGKIYIPKAIREAGFDDGLKALPGWQAIVIYPQEAKLDDVMNSLKIIISSLELQVAKSKVS